VSPRGIEKFGSSLDNEQVSGAGGVADGGRGVAGVVAAFGFDEGEPEVSEGCVQWIARDGGVFIAAPGTGETVLVSAGEFGALDDDRLGGEGVLRAPELR
jgi:hypothetical protein